MTKIKLGKSTLQGQMAIVSFLILKMLMLVSICEKAFGKIGKDEKGRGGIHSGKFSVVKFNLMTKV